MQSGLPACRCLKLLGILLVSDLLFLFSLTCLQWISFYEEVNLLFEDNTIYFRKVDACIRNCNILYDSTGL